MHILLKPSRLFWVVGLAAATVLGTHHPAWALGATTSASPYTGPCPGNAAFSGTISGASGSVTYKFFYYDPGSGQTITLPPHSANISGSGSAAVSDSGKVTGSGSAWVQLMITSPGLVYSNKANFTVACVAPPPPPPPPPSAPPASSIATPFGLTSTNDPNTCDQHGDSFACGFGIQQGDLVLIFSWSGTPPIDGYRAYRVDGGQHTLVYHHTSGASKTIAFIDKPNDGFNGKCYAVTAYKGNAESSPSTTFCVGGGTPVGIQSAGILAVQQMFFSGFKKGNTGSAAGQVVNFLSSIASNPGLSEQGFGLMCDADPVCVGFADSTNKHWYGDDYTNVWNRGGVLFDVSSIHGKNIVSATLAMQINDSFTGTDEHNAFSLNCVKRIELATSPWWNGAQWINGDDSRPITAFSQSGGLISVNVTGWVKQWASGAVPNNGLALIGPSEDPNAFTEASCATGFRLISLSVQFTS